MTKDYPTAVPSEGEHKVWNPVLHYDMDVDLNKKLDKAVMEYQGDTDLAKDLKLEDEEDMRLQIFDSAIMDAVLAGKDMYIEEGATLDKVIDDLIEWLSKCKGHEEEYKKIVEKDEKEDENEEDEEKEGE